MSKSAFQERLVSLINSESMENGSNTPDFMLAQYLVGCLENFNAVMALREKWYGRGAEANSPGAPVGSSEPSHAGSISPSLPLSSDHQSTGWRDAVIEECARIVEGDLDEQYGAFRIFAFYPGADYAPGNPVTHFSRDAAKALRSLKSPTPIISTGGEES